MCDIEKFTSKLSNLEFVSLLFDYYKNSFVGNKN